MTTASPSSPPPIISISALQRIILALYQHQQAIALNDVLLSRPGCCCAQFPTPATEFPEGTPHASSPQADVDVRTRPRAIAEQRC
jgi:hypothetical protein